MFVPNFKRIDAHLKKKLRKGESTEFGPMNADERKEMKSLKEKLIAPPLIALSSLTGKYNVDTDDFKKQVGCVLLQEQQEGPDCLI